MKYTCEITLNLPRDRVIELFDDPAHLPKWQKGLQYFEHVSGEPGKPGAKSKLGFDMNGRSLEMIETITVRNLPDEFSGTYETNGVKNWIGNRFYDEGDKTRWVTENEFKFSGVMAIMSLFISSAFRKQTLDHMNNFKRFAETGQTVSA
jgi:hypothetical protein